MKIVELSLEILENGTVVIPRRLISEMRLRPGESVRIAYLTREGRKNTYHEFFLSENGINAIGDADSGYILSIPDFLLEQAGITEQDEITIRCIQGAVVICGEDKLSLDELSAVLEQIRKINGAAKERNL